MHLLKVVLNTMVLLELLFCFSTFVNVYFRFTRQKKLKIWNLGTILSKGELNKVLFLLKREVPETDLNVTIIIFKYKYQVYFCEWITVLMGYFHSLKIYKDYSKNIKKFNTHGQYDNLAKTIFLYEFSFSKKENLIVQKMKMTITLIHEFTHRNIEMSNINITKMDEELECFRFPRTFIKANLQEFNNVFESNYEIIDLGVELDKDIIKEAYSKILK
ncbi:hypothetical protein [Clostridium tagluense]|uniref:hypothetical protein n=1 Tax=Clostridium tagluense TaxID=360422 RepID=UPI001C6F4797|nr:hypothetical protein [Clostridium tagluense]MBW9156951.1 hypothetical protein [Clostridium tagluense]WLC66421.1 hypothetical protein KTC93_04140 [Clostridium tagluense]